MTPYKRENCQVSISYSQPSNCSTGKIKESMIFSNENENNKNYQINLSNENYFLSS